jgi:hypothetical protein
MSQDEVLRMVARARDDASGPLRKVENSLRGVGKHGAEQSKQLRENFKSVHEVLNKVGEVAKAGVAPAIEAVGISSFSAVGAIAALVSGLKSFVDQGDDVAAFGRKVQLTGDTVRSLEGVGEKFHVDPGAIRQGLQGFTDVMYEVRRRRGYAFNHMVADRTAMANELAATPETEAGNEQALKIYLKQLELIKAEHGMPTARRFAKEMGAESFIDLLGKGGAALDEARKKYLALTGEMDTDGAEKWVSNWSDFKAAILGVRNEIGNDLLPDLTELARQGQEFFRENKGRIGHDIAESVREIGAALRGVNTGVESMGGWQRIFEGLIALKLFGLATNIIKVASALRLATAAFLASPPAVLAAAGYALYETVKPQPAGESDADEKARRDQEIAASGGARNQAEASRRGAAGVGAATSIIQGLRDRELDAAHTAILGGSIEQESGFDSTRPNVKEHGIGLIQWNKTRRAALQAFAAQRHQLETDAGVQLDFLMKELRETPSGRQFLAAQDPYTMNRALHSFIGYGDDSEGRRLANGRNLLPLAEKTQPGSLLAAAGKTGVMGGGATTVNGNVSFTADIKAPAGTKMRADADGAMFKSVAVNRGQSMPRASEGD